MDYPRNIACVDAKIPVPKEGEALIRIHTATI